jgi:hypothetical protein
MSSIAKTFQDIDSRINAVKPEIAEEFLYRWRGKYYQGHGYISGDLQRGCEYEIQPDAIVFRNDIDYAAFVEEGTPFMAGQHQLLATTREMEAITRVAIKRAGLS